MTAYNRTASHIVYTLTPQALSAGVQFSLILIASGGFNSFLYVWLGMALIVVACCMYTH